MVIVLKIDSKSLQIMSVSIQSRKKIILFLWRDGRVVECSCLESSRPGNRTVGSNPTLSAIYHS